MNNRFAKPIYASPGEIILKTGNKLIDSENNLYEESDPRKNVPDSRLSQGYRYKGPEVLKDTTKNVMISRRYYYEKILNKKSLIRKGYKYNSTANIIPNTQYTLNDNDVQNVIKKAINAVAYITDCNMIGIKFDNNTYTVTYYSNIDFKNDPRNGIKILQHDVSEMLEMLENKEAMALENEQDINECLKYTKDLNHISEIVELLVTCEESINSSM